MTGIQLQVLEDLVGGKLSKEAIAKKHGVSSRSIRNWLANDEDFKQTYEETIHAVLEEASAEAVATITDLMRNAESETVRLNAAKDVLSRAGYDATAKNKVDLAMPNDIVINIIDDE